MENNCEDSGKPAPTTPNGTYGPVLSPPQNVPKVSIGLPVYNGEKYIAEAIESLLNQTFCDFELIISDNASEDDTPAIIAKYCRQDQRIRALRQDINIGAANNFLYVLNVSRAALFMWASHDDIWAENWLEILTRELSPNDVGVRGKVRLLEKTKIVAIRTLPNYKKGDFIKCFFGNENNYRSHYAYCLFNKAKLMACKPGAYNLDYYPDAIFVYNLLQQGALRTIPDTYMLYRIHDQNLGKEYSRPWKGWKKILYRIHPLRYYLYYLRYTPDGFTKFLILALIPVKHLYSQGSFWVRGVREIITGKPVF